MKKVILSLALISAGLFSSYACTAKASSNAASASTETTAAAPSEETAADDKAAEGAIKHIDAAYLRKYIWDYKEEPSKFVSRAAVPLSSTSMPTGAVPAVSSAPSSKPSLRSMRVRSTSTRSMSTRKLIWPISSV